MARLRPAARKLTAPVTGRMDRYLAAVIDEVHEVKNELLGELAAADARAAERHLALSTRLTALEDRVRTLAEKNSP